MDETGKLQREYLSNFRFLCYNLPMTLTMDDLIGVCGECNGTGARIEESRPNGGTVAGRRIVYLGSDGPDKCGKCAGTGRAGVTETGKVIGEFAEIYQALKKSDRLG